MSTSIQFHRELDETLFMKIGYSSQPMRVSYLNEENEEIEMSLELFEGQEKVHQVVDPRVHWDPNVHNLMINQEIQIANPQFLFGSGGIVSEKSSLGVAFKWYSKDSSQIKVMPLKEIVGSDLSEQSVNLNVNISKGTLRGSVTFEIIMYILESDKKNLIPGTVLGQLETNSIILDGNSSMFPIVEVNYPGKPLWWVSCEFDDPLHDEFSEENVAIVLNNGHNQFKFLKIEKGLSSSPLLLEIIASGLQIIVEKVKNTGAWQEILNGENESGSIGEALFYFISTFSWDTTSPEKLARSIREDFDNRFK